MIISWRIPPFKKYMQTRSTMAFVKKNLIRFQERLNSDLKLIQQMDSEFPSFKDEWIPVMNEERGKDRLKTHQIRGGFVAGLEILPFHGGFQHESTLSIHLRRFSFSTLEVKEKERKQIILALVMVSSLLVS